MKECIIFFLIIRNFTDLVKGLRIDIFCCLQSKVRTQNCEFSDHDDGREKNN